MNKGQIQLIIGPMFCGKSTELIRRINRYIRAKRSFIALKYEKDTRYETDIIKRKIMTHDGISIEAYPCSKLFDAIDLIKDVEVVGIDEGQFFADIAEFADKVADMGKIVVISALDGDFQRKPFGRIYELIPKAEEIIKLRAICAKCGGEASFSKRTVASTEVELIGGSESYVAACRHCYHI